MAAESSSLTGACVAVLVGRVFFHQPVVTIQRSPPSSEATAALNLGKVGSSWAGEAPQVVLRVGWLARGNRSHIKGSLMLRGCIGLLIGEVKREGQSGTK